MATTRTRRPGWEPLALCLILTGVASAVVGHSEQQAERARFDNHMLATLEHIRERMASYMDVLRAAAGFVSSHASPRDEDFRVFVSRLDLPTHFRGTQGIGYTERFGNVSVEEATRRARTKGWNVRVWPETPRAEVHSIVMIEPRDVRNLAALGFDMYSEPTRRAGMDRARDLGDVALTGKVTLVQEIEEEKQPGFLLYSPVYEGGVIPATLAERRSKLRGYAYAPLRAGDLFDGIFGDERPPVAYEVYDGSPARAGDLLYKFGRPLEESEHVVEKTIVVGGQTWEVRLVPASPSWGAWAAALEVATLGVALSIIVLLVTRARQRARERELQARATILAQEENLRVKDMFVGILGHDLLNPLNAIGLTSDLLSRRLRHDERGLELAARIRDSTKRMTRMIDQILDLTRLQLGDGIPVKPRAIHLDSLVRDLVDEAMLAQPDGIAEVDVRGDCAGDWDPDRLAQVVSNLVTNAIAHRGTRAVEVRVDGTAPDHVSLRVHNAGAIPPELLPHVFEPFRGSKHAQRSRAGLGLGLYITREIVRAHHGTIAVESSDLGGTTFTVQLPRPQRSPTRRTSSPSIPRGDGDHDDVEPPARRQADAS